MEKLASPETNFRASDAVLAQTVGADADWQIDSAGHIYDARGVIISKDLFELGEVMRELGWFTPKAAAGSGVQWSNVPRSGVERGDHARARLRTRQ